MYKYDISIKSGTGGWYDYDGCDKCVAKLETHFLPRVGETIQILTKDENKKSNYISYLIRDVNYWYIDKDKNGINVYVIPIQ